MERPKSFEEQIKAAFEAGLARGRYEVWLSGGQSGLPHTAPQFEVWRKSLGDPK